MKLEAKFIFAQRRLARSGRNGPVCCTRVRYSGGTAPQPSSLSNVGSSTSAIALVPCAPLVRHGFWILHVRHGHETKFAVAGWQLDLSGGTGPVCSARPTCLDPSRSARLDSRLMLACLAQVKRHLPHRRGHNLDPSSPLIRGCHDTAAKWSRRRGRHVTDGVRGTQLTDA